MSVLFQEALSDEDRIRWDPVHSQTSDQNQVLNQINSVHFETLDEDLDQDQVFLTHPSQSSAVL